ncbi:hypothetical protein RIF29_39734 [Crotalaria pallida]|uniref:Protein BIC1 n=1 Tax=Crotalaria pallida TaxID=3830 RepID=A0AAN9HMR9_CROPI
MAHQSSSAESNDKIPSQTFDLNNNMEQQQEGPLLLSHDDAGDRDNKDVTTQNPSASKTHLKNNERTTLKEVVEDESVEAEDSGREKLKRHRVEVAGSVWIPDMWGQEELLKDWIDCTTAFDATLVPSRITSAREALVQEGRKVNAAGLSIENRC